MRFRSNNPLIRILSSRFFLIFCLVLILWLGSALSKEFYRKHQTDKELEAIKNEISEVEKKNKELAALIEFFKDQSFIEKEVRERLNLKKPDENVVIIVDEEGNSKIDSGPKEDSESAQDSINHEKLAGEEISESGEFSNPEKWWHYIFGR